MFLNIKLIVTNGLLIFFGSLNVYGQMPLNECFSFSLPKEVEVQKVDDREMQKMLNNSGYRNSVILQQHGLNDNNRESFNTYFRYVIKQQDSDDEYPQLYLEIMREPHAYLEVVKKMIPQIIQSDCMNQDSCILSMKVSGPYKNNSVIYYKIDYQRYSTISNLRNEKLNINFYMIYRENGFFTIKSTYLMRDKSVWAIVLEQLNKNEFLKF